MSLELTNPSQCQTAPCRWLSTFAFICLALGSAPSLFAQPFTKVADFNTAIPSGAGNFTQFDIPAIYGNNVAFYGAGSSSQQGVYLSSNGTLSKIANLQTPIPGSSGNFTNFAGYEVTINSLGVVGFRAQGASVKGVYKSSNATLSRIADTSFAIPGGSGNFAQVFAANDSGGISAFGGSDINFKSGIYTSSGSAATRLLDTSTVLPGGTEKYSFTDYVINDNGVLTFWATKSDGFQGIYSYLNSSVRLIADTNSVVPGTGAKFVSFLSPPSIAGTTVTFIGSFVNGGSQSGVFSANSDGTGLARLVDTASTAADGTKFGAFYGGFGFVNGALYFAGNTLPSFVMAVYKVSGGSITKVLAAGDALDGKTVKSANLGTLGGGGGKLVLTVIFTDNTTGIYTSPTSPPVIAPSFTAKSSGGGGFQMSLSLTTGGNYRLQGNADVTNSASWITLTNINNAPASMTYTDSGALALPGRFYRIVQP